MSVYRYKNGYRLDFRVNAPTKGEKPVRITRVFSTKTEALHAEKQLNEQLESAQQQYTSKQRQRIIIEADNGKNLDIQSHPSLLYIRTAFLTAIECAMRRGKLFEMQWSWIDWKSKDIVVPSQLQGPKNKGVPSRVPMSPRLFQALETLRGPRQIGAALDTPVFGRLTADRAYRLLKSVCEALEIHVFRWHDLRHEACSRLAERGWIAPQIQAVSGHKTLQSLQRYVHVSTEAAHRLSDRDQRKADQLRKIPAVANQAKELARQAMLQSTLGSSNSSTQQERQRQR